MDTQNHNPTIQEIQSTLLKASGLVAVLGYAEMARDYMTNDIKTSPAPCDYKAATDIIGELISNAQGQLEWLERGQKMEAVA